MTSYENVWRDYERNGISHSVAHYLLAIGSFKNEQVEPRAADIARKLGVSRNAVSLQINTLKAAHLVKVDTKHRISLTSKGRKISAQIASKRHTMQVFLSEVLGVSGDVAESDACKVEHLLSEETGDALAKFVSFLRSDSKEVLGFLSEFQQHYVGCDPSIGCGLCDNIDQISSTQEKREIGVVYDS